jgi:hypothetical protein
VAGQDAALGVATLRVDLRGDAARGLRDDHAAARGDVVRGGDGRPVGVARVDGGGERRARLGVPRRRDRERLGERGEAFARVGQRVGHGVTASVRTTWSSGVMCLRRVSDESDSPWTMGRVDGGGFLQIPRTACAPDKRETMEKPEQPDAPSTRILAMN